MIALIQRVSSAKVLIEGDCVGAIGHGLLALVAVERDDTETQAERMAERLVGYRVFPDASQHMNRSLLDIEGEILLVPQFTLAADTRKGSRPSFTPAAEPERARLLYECLVQCVQRRTSQVATGRFGADMQVHLVNDGPVTLLLRSGVEDS